MYSSCARAWLAVSEFRKKTGIYGCEISHDILHSALVGLEETAVDDSVADF